MGDTSSYLRDHPIGNTEFLVGKAKEGSQAAWEVILDRYRKMLKVHVRSRLGAGFEPEDVLQTAFMKAFQHIETFEYRGEGSFRRWLATLVIRSCANERKVRRPETDVDGALEHVEDQGSSSKLEQYTEQASLLEALGKLDDDDRDILIQRKIEELSFEKIGENLGVSREAARKRYALAQERLRRSMQD